VPSPKTGPLRQVLRAIGHQRWLRGRQRFIRAFANPNRIRSERFEVPFFGRTYAGDFANLIDWHVYFFGAYSLEELLVLRMLADNLEGPVYFYDVGANVGHHTLFMSNCSEKVFAFEPYDLVRRELTRKLACAGVANVQVYPIALGDAKSTGRLHIPEGSNLGTSTLTGHLPGNASGLSVEVPVVKGDDYLSAFPPISILKIDVEGFEPKVLAGLRERLLRDRPPILMETMSGTFESEAQMRSLLYPDHVIFEVGHHLSPFRFESSREVLVIPRGRLEHIVTGRTY
jgi:FkbM family methyltransferase